MKVKKFFKILVELDKLNQQFNQELNEGIKAAKQKLKEEEEMYQKYGPTKFYEMKNNCKK